MFAITIPPETGVGAEDPRPLPVSRLRARRVGPAPVLAGRLGNGLDTTTALATIPNTTSPTATSASRRFIDVAPPGTLPSPYPSTEGGFDMDEPYLSPSCRPLSELHNPLRFCTLRVQAVTTPRHLENHGPHS